MRGWTPTLTTTVTVEAFREVVEEVGADAAAERLQVTPKTVTHWTIGLGMPQPRHWDQIDNFVKAEATR